MLFQEAACCLEISHAGVDASVMNEPVKTKESTL